jgi:hypothetical protein
MTRAEAIAEAIQRRILANQARTRATLNAEPSRIAPVQIVASPKRTRRKSVHTVQVTTRKNPKV